MTEKKPKKRRIIPVLGVCFMLYMAYPFFALFAENPRGFLSALASPQADIEKALKSEPRSLEEMLADYEITDPAHFIPDWAGKRKDEPFDVKAYYEERMPPRENAAPLYLKAMAHYSSAFNPMLPESEQAEHLERTTQLEKQINEYIAKEWLAENADSPEVKQLLEEVKPYLEMIEEAQRTPECLFITTLNTNEDVPHLTSSRSLARLAAIEIAHYCAMGDLRSSEKAIERTLKLSSDLIRRGGTMPYLISSSMRSGVIGAIREYVLTCSLLSENDCDRLLMILRKYDPDFTVMVRESLMAEYIECVNGLADLPYNLRLRQFGYQAEDGRVMNEAYSILLSGDDQDEAFELYDEYVRMHDNKMEDISKGYKGILNGVLIYFRLRPMPSIFASLKIHQGHVLRESRDSGKAKYHSALMAVAVKRYQLQHGELPETLEQAAVEAGFEGVLSDPYDNQPLRYVILDGQAIVYAIGPDLKDDGGVIDWDFGKQPGDVLFLVP